MITTLMVLIRRYRARLGDRVVGVVWLIGLTSLVVDSRIPERGDVATFLRTNNAITIALLTGVVATVECYLGIRLLAERDSIARVLSSGLLLVFAVILAWHGSVFGFESRCSCLGVVSQMSISSGVARNIILSILPWFGGMYQLMRRLLR